MGFNLLEAIEKESKKTKMCPECKKVPVGITKENEQGVQYHACKKCMHKLTYGPIKENHD